MLAWPSAAGCAVLGLGYATPYLRAWSAEAARCIAAVPGPVRVARWPGAGGNFICTTEEDALPFPDLCFDRILLVHGLEAADNARAMLREVWRVLKDDGRLLVVVPNRMGMWAHVESTPFGHGQPYSPGQIGRLLAGCMFRVERRDTALHLPPVTLRLALRSARTWEGAGRWMAPHLAGVTITGGGEGRLCRDAGEAGAPADGVERGRMTLDEAFAARLVAIGLGHVTREFPHALSHVMEEPGDVAPPRAFASGVLWQLRLALLRAWLLDAGDLAEAVSGRGGGRGGSGAVRCAADGGGGRG